MALPIKTRYVEWTAVTEGSAANIGSVIAAQANLDAPVQDYSGEKAVGSRWVFDKIVHDGTNFVLLFWRYNHVV